MSQPINDGGPAFPHKRQIRCNGEVIDYVMESGISIRDYFAAAALQGLIASRGSMSTRFLAEDDASYVYEIADAMLKAREDKL